MSRQVVDIPSILIRTTAISDDEFQLGDLHG